MGAAMHRISAAVETLMMVADRIDMAEDAVRDKPRALAPAAEDPDSAQAVADPDPVPALAVPDLAHAETRMLTQPRTSVKKVRKKSRKIENLRRPRPRRPKKNRQCCNSSVRGNRLAGGCGGKRTMTTCDY
jgi:hypothetical protein